ncbi:MAG: hypothetical protein AAF846_25560 [Chloroflexota bacterium]
MQGSHNFTITPQKQAITSIPAIVRHMMIFGVLFGIIVGTISQFIITDIIRETLSTQATLSFPLMRTVLWGEALAMLGTSLLALLCLRFVWQAPSWRAKFANGFAITTGLVLTAHALLGRVNGAFYNRDLWIAVQRPLDLETSYDLQTMTIATVNTIVQGMGYQVALLTLLPLLGGLFGLLLLRRDSTKPLPETKQVFGSLAMVVLPLHLLIFTLTNATIFTVLVDVINDLVLEHNVNISTELILPMMWFAPLLMMLMTQLGGLIWLANAHPQTLHRRMLKVSAYIMLFVPLCLLPLLYWANPAYFLSSIGFFSLFVFTLLAWSHSILAFIKARRITHKRDIHRRVKVISLFVNSLIVFTLVILLMDYFVTSVPLNMVLYTVVFIGGDALSVNEVLSPNSLQLWLYFAPALIGYVTVSSIITTGFMWLINIKER